MANYGQLWPIMANYGQLWPIMANYGQLWPIPLYKATDLIKVWAISLIMATLNQSLRIHCFLLCRGNKSLADYSQLA